MYGCMSVVYRPAERVIDLLYGDYQQNKKCFFCKNKKFDYTKHMLVCMYVLRNNLLFFCYVVVLILYVCKYVCMYALRYISNV